MKGTTHLSLYTPQPNQTKPPIRFQFGQKLCQNWKNQLIICKPNKHQKQKDTEEKETKQEHAYKINLTETTGQGEFLCPRCGTLISPDDTTENEYAIIEPKVNHQGLTEIIIQCKHCQSIIHLTGFAAQQILTEEIDDPMSNRKKTPADYFAHI